LLILTLLAAAHAEPLAMDFGLPSEPTVHGMVRVGPDGLPASGVTIEQGEIRAGLTPDPVSGGALMAGQVQLDLPAGSYRLISLQAFLGRAPITLLPPNGFGLRANSTVVLHEHPPTDPFEMLHTSYWAAHPIPVFTPGESPWERAVRDLMPWHETVVEVGKDPLVLEAFGRPLSALIVLPADEPIEPHLAAIDAARGAWYLGHEIQAEERFYTIEEPKLTLLEELPDAQPWREPLTTYVGGSTAAVWWLPAGDWTVTSEGDPVELYDVIWWDHSSPRSRLVTPAPVWLRPSEGAPPNQNQPVGIALRVVGENPGTHRVQLRAHGPQELALELEVKVAPAKLAAPELIVGTNHSWDRARYSMAPPEQAFEMADRELTRLSELGIRYLHLGAYLPPAKGFDAHVAEKWGELGGEIIAWNRPLLVLNRWLRQETEFSTQRVEEMAKLIQGLPAAPGMRRVVGVYDEAGAWHHAPYRARSAAFVDAMRPLIPEDIELAAAGGHPFDWPFAEHVDVFAYGNFPPSSAERTAEIAPYGADVWSYNTPRGLWTGTQAWAANTPVVSLWASWDHTITMTDPIQFAFRSAGLNVGPDGEVWTEMDLMGVSVGLDIVAMLEQLPHGRARGKACKGLLASSETLETAVRGSLQGAEPMEGDRHEIGTPRDAQRLHDNLVTWWAAWDAADCARRVRAESPTR